MFKNLSIILITLLPQIAIAHGFLPIGVIYLMLWWSIVAVVMLILLFAWKVSFMHKVRAVIVFFCSCVVIWYVILLFIKVTVGVLSFDREGTLTIAAFLLSYGLMPVISGIAAYKSAGKQSNA